MACGSVAQSEGAISLASLSLTRCDLNSSPTSSEKSESSSSRNRRSIYRGDDVHEAILFLQKEHESLLSGLHKQIEYLQQKCDDLQFETHLKHIITNEEEILRKKIFELTNSMKEKTQQLTFCKRRLEEQDKTIEEEREQHRWKELKLQQQIEVSNQRTSELKSEVARLKGQVHDLKVFSSALRTSSVGPPSGIQRQCSASKASLSSAKPSLSLHRASQESLDSLGPRSLGSEEGDLGMWREARLGSGGGKFVALRGARPQSSQSFQPGSSLPPLSPSGAVSRPSSSISSVLTLPPISQPRGASKLQGSSRPHVRRQLRLLSAPNLDLPMKSPKYPP